jgi:hypothetical protein
MLGIRSTHSTGRWLAEPSLAGAQEQHVLAALARKDDSLAIEGLLKEGVDVNAMVDQACPHPLAEPAISPACANHQMQQGGAFMLWYADTQAY